MQRIIEKAKDLIKAYEDQLARLGMEIVVSIKYMDENTEADGTAANVKSKGEKRPKNGCPCLVISALPTEERMYRDACREYAFFLRRVNRASKADKRKRLTHEEDKLLAKIEKRILSLLSKTENNTLKKVCKNSFFDAFRYSFSSKYLYKKSFCGKKRSFWDAFFCASAIVIGLVIAGVIILLEYFL